MKMGIDYVEYHGIAFELGTGNYRMTNLVDN